MCKVQMYAVVNNRLYAVKPAFSANLNDETTETISINFISNKRRCCLKSLIFKYNEELNNWRNKHSTENAHSLDVEFVHYFNNTFLKQNIKGEKVWCIN